MGLLWDRRIADHDLRLGTYNERQYLRAMDTYPVAGNSAAVEAWENEHGHLVSAYQSDLARYRAKRRRWHVAWRWAVLAFVAVLLVTGGIIGWRVSVHRDLERRTEAFMQQRGDVLAQIAANHHVEFIPGGSTPQSLRDGEGGWTTAFDLAEVKFAANHLEPGSFTVGAIRSDTALSGTGNGNFGFWHSYMSNSGFYGYHRVLVERHGNQVTATLFRTPCAPEPDVLSNEPVRGGAGTPLRVTIEDTSFCTYGDPTANKHQDDDE